MTKARVLGLGFGILLIAAAFGIVLWQAANMPATNTAFAQGAATATPAAGATPKPQSQSQSSIGDTFWTQLAAKLGVSADDLKAKAVETRKDMINQAVADGRITQAQADAINARLDANNLIAPIPLPRGAQPNSNTQPRRGPFGGFGNMPPGRGFGQGGIVGRGVWGSSLQELEAVASALKLEPKALIEQLSQGKSLADIATAQGVDQAAVKQAIIDYRTKQIDQLLALGLISEVQANALKARLTPDNIDLSRGFRFQFRSAPGQKSSQALPEFEWGTAFGAAPDIEFFEFGEMPFEGFMLPFADIQTQ